MSDVSEKVRLSKAGWLPLVLCPTDGVDRALLLPDGREVVGAYHNGGLGQLSGWHVSTPFEREEPVYEYTPRGGFVADWSKPRPHQEPARKQVGTRKVTLWLVGKLPEGVYPTHFRPNDTVYGAGRAALHQEQDDA